MNSRIELRWISKRVLRLGFINSWLILIEGGSFLVKLSFYYWRLLRRELLELRLGISNLLSIDSKRDGFGIRLASRDPLPEASLIVLVLLNWRSYMKNSSLSLSFSSLFIFFEMLKEDFFEWKLDSYRLYLSSSNSRSTIWLFIC